MRRIAILLTLAALSGCAGERAPEAGPPASPSPAPEGLRLTLAATPDGPLARLAGSFGEAEVAPYTYCWSSPRVSECGDGFPTEPETYAEASRGDLVEILGDAGSVELGTAAFPPGEVAARVQTFDDLPIRGGVARLDLEPGRYLLHVSATFPQGDGFFTLGLRIA